MSNFNQSPSGNNLSLLEQLFPLPINNSADSNISNNFNSGLPFLPTETDFISPDEDFAFSPNVYITNVYVGESFFHSILNETEPATEEMMEDSELIKPLGEPELSPTEPVTEESIEDSELIEPLGEPELSPTEPATEESIEDVRETLLGEPELSPEEEATLTQSVTVGNPEGTQFTFNYAKGIDQQFIDGVSAAAEDWSSRLTDDVDISIDLTFTPDFTSEEEGVSAVALPNFIPITYGRVRQALVDDATSSNDEIATANLIEGDDLSLLINNTSENNGSDTPYLDDNGGLNNSFILLNSANAKALGLSLEELAAIVDTTPEDVAANISLVSDNYPVDANAADALINFDSETVWDFDRSDGIGLEAIDFVGVATHEIGHVLGFNSSTADDLDAAANPNLDALDVLAPLLPEDITAETETNVDINLASVVDAIAIDPFVSENQYIPQTFDLFRYTLESVEVGALDFTTGNISDKYFSIDGGQTEIAPLSTGLTTGDFQQLSHWLDDDSIGIMAPIISPGEQEEITDTDLLAFDVIGWDLAST